MKPDTRNADSIAATIRNSRLFAVPTATTPRTVTASAYAQPAFVTRCRTPPSIAALSFFQTRLIRPTASWHN